MDILNFIFQNQTTTIIFVIIAAIIVIRIIADIFILKAIDKINIVVNDEIKKRGLDK